MVDKTFIIWAEYEGDVMKAAFATREQYDKALKSGVIKLSASYRGIGAKETFKFHTIAFGTVEEVTTLSELTI